MSVHRKSDKNARKAKYERQKSRTERNKKKNLEKMKTLNPCYPNKKGTC